METKICSHCKEEKELYEYYKNKRSKGGYLNICKHCKLMYAYEYHINNRLKILERNKIRHRNNSEKDNEKSAKYRKNNPEKVKKCLAEWYRNNQEYFIINKEKLKKQNEESRKRNHEKRIKTSKRMRLKMTDGYITQTLVQLAISKETIKIHPELIQLKRALLMFSRKIKESSN